MLADAPRKISWPASRPAASPPAAPSRWLVLAALTVACLAEALSAQTLWHASSGPFPGAKQGAAVGLLGDLNGDGFAEWMAGRGGKSATEKKPQLRVWSGQDGSRLYVLQGFGSINGLFLQSLDDIGDVDGDGVDDFAFGNSNAKVGLMSNAGKVAAYSGASGATLWITPGAILGGAFGSSLAPLGDVTGDGVSDLVVGALGSLNENAWVLDGVDGAMLYKVKGPGGGDLEFGYAVAPTGDLSGDGVPDFAVGTLSGALVQFFSGADGVLLRTVNGPPGFGNCLADLGDVNGDSLRDLAVSDELNQAVQIVSGLDGSILTLVSDPQGVEFGAALCATGDMDADGISDLAVGDPGAFSQAGRVSVYSGASGQRLFQLHGSQPGSRFGDALAGGRDVSGDGRPDLAVGEPRYHGQGRNLGRVSIWTGPTR